MWPIGVGYCKVLLFTRFCSDFFSIWLYLIVYFQKSFPKISTNHTIKGRVFDFDCCPYVEFWGYCMLGLCYVRDVGCWRCGMLGMWDVGDMGFWGCGMLGMWDVRDVGCSRCEMFGMWDVPDVGCLGCGMFVMWDVQDVQDVGYSGCGMCGMWDVRDVECRGCGIFGMCNVEDVGCSWCGMFGEWDVRDVGCGMWDACWDVGCWFTKCLKKWARFKVEYFKGFFFLFCSRHLLQRTLKSTKHAISRSWRLHAITCFDEKKLHFSLVIRFFGEKGLAITLLKAIRN